MHSTFWTASKYWIKQFFLCCGHLWVVLIQRRITETIFKKLTVMGNIPKIQNQNKHYQVWVKHINYILGEQSRNHLVFLQDKVNFLEEMTYRETQGWIGVHKMNQDKKKSLCKITEMWSKTQMVQRQFKTSQI